MDIKHLQELSNLAKLEGERYPLQRDLISFLKKDHGKLMLGVAGSRGSGKTVLLRQLLAELENSFYLSVDSQQDLDLFQLAKELNENFKIEYLLLDEVHFHPQIDEQLKKIFDFLPLKIIFTSSVALLMQKSAYDLSRRVKLFSLRTFSFREYLYFKSNSKINLPILSLDQIITNQFSSEYLAYENEFDKYLSGHNLPFALEVADPLTQLAKITNKVIEQDIPRIADITFDELLSVKNCLKFIGKSQVDGINPTSLAKNCGITKYKAEQYIEYLQRAYLLNVTYPKGTNVLKEPKITLALPYRLIYSGYQDSIGGIREDFAVDMLQASKQELFYLKGPRGQKYPDYYLELEDKPMVIEVGGAGKTSKQLKSYKTKQKYQSLLFRHGGASSKDSRSLALLGFFY